MFTGLGSLLTAWLSREPSAGLMMVVTAVMLFGTVFKRLRSEERFYSAFAAQLFLGIVHALVFIGITGAFYILLDSSYKSFKPLAAALAQGAEFQKERLNSMKNWGAPLYQGDLIVTQTTSHVEVAEVSGANETTLYINQTVVDPVEQESIIHFNGLVNIHVVDERLNTYTLDAKYEYDIVNQSDKVTTAKFQFPVGRDRIFKDLSVTVDGEDIGSQKRIQDEMLSWEETMQPHQKLTVVISFVTRGMELYAFQIPEKKPIQDFSLTVNVDSLDMYVFSQPDSSAIILNRESTANGHHTSWRIKNSIIAPNIGIILKQREQTDANQERVIRISEYMARGLILLLVVVVFTMLICSVPVNLWKLALLAAVFSANFLVLMGLDLMQIDHPIILPILAISTLVITLMIYRKLPQLPLRLILFSTSVFLLGYPYAGLFSEGSARIAFDSFMQVLIILYIFVLAFYVRVRGNKAVPEE